MFGSEGGQASAKQRGARRAQRGPRWEQGEIPPGSDNPRSVDFPRWLIGGATSGRVRHVPAGAPKAGYFAAFFLRSAQ